MGDESGIVTQPGRPGQRACVVASETRLRQVLGFFAQAISMW
jgi:hypothetical protein